MDNQLSQVAYSVQSEEDILNLTLAMVSAGQPFDKAIGMTVRKKVCLPSTVIRSGRLMGISNVPTLVKADKAAAMKNLEIVESSHQGGFPLEAPKFFRSECSTEQVTHNEQQFAETSTIAALIVVALSGYSGDRIGRAPTMMIAYLFYLVGAVLSFADVAHFIVYEFLVSLGVGALGSISLVYVSESASHKERGAIVGTYSLGYGVGQFLPRIISSKLGKVKSSFRYMFGLPCITALFGLILVLRSRETPRWLQAKTPENEKVMDAIKLIYPPRKVSKEIASLCLHVTGNPAGVHILPRKGFFKSLWEPLSSSVRRKFFEGIICTVLQPFSGIIIIMLRGDKIENIIGHSTDDLDLSVACYGLLIYSLGSLVCIFLVDHFGRKPLMITGLVGAAVLHLVLGWLLGKFQTSAHDLKYRAVLGWWAICTYEVCIFCYSLGIGSVAMIITCEIFPLRGRSTSSAWASMANWAARLAAYKMFTVLRMLIGPEHAFYVFGAILFAGALVIGLIVTETKRKRLELC